MKSAISRAARRDIISIWGYIAEDSVDAADRWRDKIHAAIQSIADAPGIGHTRPDVTEQNILFWPVGSHLILYRTGRSRVEIAAVVHGARDVLSFLEIRGLQ